MWYEIIIAIAGGSLGAIATLVAGVYRKTQDRKETWWERFTWASSALQSSDEGTRGAARDSPSAFNGRACNARRPQGR